MRKIQSSNKGNARSENFRGQKNCEKMKRKKKSQGLSRRSVAKAEARIQESGGGSSFRARARRFDIEWRQVQTRQRCRQVRRVNVGDHSSVLFEHEDEHERSSWLLYFAATGTGITSLPSFSAMKLSLVPDELPLASLVSAVIFNFFVGFNGSFNFVPPGPS